MDPMICDNPIVGVDPIGQYLDEIELLEKIQKEVERNADTLRKIQEDISTLKGCFGTLSAILSNKEKSK